MTDERAARIAAAVDRMHRAHPSARRRLAARPSVRDPSTSALDAFTQILVYYLVDEAAFTVEAVEGACERLSTPTRLYLPTISEVFEAAGFGAICARREREFAAQWRETRRGDA